MTAWHQYVLTLAAAWLATTPTGGAAAALADRVRVIPNVPFDGAYAAEMTSAGPRTLDFQKTAPYPNVTGYDWWYFDAVGVDNPNEAVTIVFMEQGQNGFFGGVEGQLLTAIADFTFANGTTLQLVLAADSAVIREGRWGISGSWKGTGFSFQGLPPEDLGTIYAIEVDSPDSGIKGIFYLSGTAPPHYPCSGDMAGSTEVIVPSIGWANVLPDAVAAVDFTINGTKLSFVGAGYHDKNWGDGTSFVDVVSSWYWGHARLGPYSVVWFDTLTTDGTEYFSGYVAKDGQVVEASCTKDSAVARPYGANSTYPPTPTSGTPSGLGIKFDLGQEGVLAVNVTTGNVITNYGVYERITGPASGGLVGGPQYQGVGLHETFKFGTSKKL